MKKKIILLAFALMLFAGIVSASSINGDYKGSPIVTVTSNGKLLETDEVPGMILDGHTVVPISLLRQMGASVTWDAYAYNVEVKLPLGSPSNAEATNKQGVDEIYNALGPSGNNSINSVDYGISKGISQISFNLNFIASDRSNEVKYQMVMDYGYNSGAKQIKIEDNSAIYIVNVGDIADLKNGKITVDEYYARLKMTNKNESTNYNQSPPKQILPDPANNNSNVKNGDSGAFQFIGVNDFYNNNGTYHIAGQIKNITGKNMSGGVEIIITLFDQNGNVVGTQSGVASGAYSLKNGETAPFDIPFFTVPNNYTRYEIKAKS